MKFSFPSCSFLNTNAQFATSLFVCLSLFCWCILELGNKATLQPAAFRFCISVFRGWFGRFSLAEGPEHKRTGEGFARGDGAVVAEPRCPGPGDAQRAAVCLSRFQC